MKSVAPVMKLEASDARKTAAGPSSTGSPQRPSGTFASIWARGGRVVQERRVDLGGERAGAEGVDVDPVARPTPGRASWSGASGPPCSRRRASGRACEISPSMLETLITRPHFCRFIGSADRPAAEPGALQVGVDHLVPVVLGELLDRPADVDPGVVDQDVEPAERVERPRRPSPRRRAGDGHVGGDARAPRLPSSRAISSADLGGLARRRGPSARPTAPAEARASAITRPRPSRPARHQRHLAVEPEPIQDAPIACSSPSSCSIRVPMHSTPERYPSNLSRPCKSRPRPSGGARTASGRRTLRVVRGMRSPVRSQRILLIIQGVCVTDVTSGQTLRFGKIRATGKFGETS